MKKVAEKERKRRAHEAAVAGQGAGEMPEYIPTVDEDSMAHDVIHSTAEPSKGVIPAHSLSGASSLQGNPDPEFHEKYDAGDPVNAGMTDGEREDLEDEQLKADNLYQDIF